MIKKQMNESPSTPLIQNIGNVLQNIDSVLQQLEAKPTYTININSGLMVSRCPSIPIDFSEYINEGKIAVYKVTHIPVMDAPEKKLSWEIQLEEITSCAANEGIFIKNKTQENLQLQFTASSIFTTPHKDNLIIGEKTGISTKDLALPPNTVVGLIGSGNKIYTYFWPLNYANVPKDRAYIFIEVTNDFMQELYKKIENEKN